MNLTDKIPVECSSLKTQIMKKWVLGTTYVRYVKS